MWIYLFHLLLFSVLLKWDQFVRRWWSGKSNHLLFHELRDAMVELLRFTANESQTCTIVRNLRRETYICRNLTFSGATPCLLRLQEQHDNFRFWENPSSLKYLSRLYPQDIWTRVKKFWIFLSSKFKPEFADLSSHSLIKSFGWVTLSFINRTIIRSPHQSPILLWLVRRHVIVLASSLSCFDSILKFKFENNSSR